MEIKHLDPKQTIEHLERLGGQLKRELDERIEKAIGEISMATEGLEKLRHQTMQDLFQVASAVFVAELPERGLTYVREFGQVELSLCGRGFKLHDISGGDRELEEGRSYRALVYLIPIAKEETGESR